ncbi:MAG: hypothetical protein ACSHXW_20490, partial [Yoonia sp.]
RRPMAASCTIYITFGAIGGMRQKYCVGDQLPPNSTFFRLCRLGNPADPSDAEISNPAMAASFPGL